MSGDAAFPPDDGPPPARPLPPERRVADRRPLILNVQCLLGCERPAEVWLIDVSRTGCQLFLCAGLVENDEGIVLVRQGERHHGRIAWASGTKAGVQFELPVAAEMLETLLAARPATARAIAEVARRSARVTLVDQFGRPLSPLPPLHRTRHLR